MFSRIEPNSTTGGVGRLLARQLARELTKDELRLIAGGLPAGGHCARSSTSWSSSLSGEGDDGGGDD
jgi:hypothetical protein